MKHLIRLSVITVLFLGIISCTSNSPTTPLPPNLLTFNATLNGTSEVPSNASTATGTAVLVFNNTSKTFTITINYSGITATASHIHSGAIGVSGGVVFPLDITNNPIIYTSAALTTAQEADLKANLYYVNIHSTAFPNGEIRGQLILYVAPSSGGY